jgi:hypothetical protein
MTSLVAAVMMLLLGAAACLLPLNNHMRAGVGVFSRVIATGLVLSIVTPVLIGGAPPTAELAWAYPVMGEGPIPATQSWH